MLHCVYIKTKNKRSRVRRRQTTTNSPPVPIQQVHPQHHGRALQQAQARQPRQVPHCQFDAAAAARPGADERDGLALLPLLRRRGGGLEVQASDSGVAEADGLPVEPLRRDRGGLQLLFVYRRRGSCVLVYIYLKDGCFFLKKEHPSVRSMFAQLPFWAI